MQACNTEADSVGFIVQRPAGALQFEELSTSEVQVNI